jgi:hypothetical protein
MRNIIGVGILAVAVALSVASAAPDQQQQQGGYQQGAYGDPTGCGPACAHYYQCKGMPDPNLIAQCQGSCQQQNPDPGLLAQYTQTDCYTAVSMVEQQGGMGGGGYQGGQQAGPGPGSKECEGCKRWGEQCAWASESNWGSGPYSGAVQDCPQSCCP